VSQEWSRFRSRVGYVLLLVSLLLISVAWFRSFPLSVESRASYLYDSTNPCYWIGLSITNVALFLIASNSKRRWERFACGFAFFISTYSMTYFFTFGFGPDWNFFRGLTENFAANGVWHLYHQWPMLFVLGTITSRVLGMTVGTACRILFFAWNLAFVGALFLYSSQESPVMDFLAVVAYTVAVNPYMVWQFSAQTFALTLLVICVVFLSGKGVSFRIAALIVYSALVLSHAFLAVFLLLAIGFMAVAKDRRYFTVAVLFGLIYVLNTIRGATTLIPMALDQYAQIYREYLLQANLVQAEPVSWLDALGRTVSLLTTISMWALLGFATLSCWIHRRLRLIDISIVLSALVYAIVGVIGWRAIQILFIPTNHALRSMILKGSVRKLLLAFFLSALVVFPVVLIHRSYNVTVYVTLREQHAADTIFIATAQNGGETGYTMMVRNRVYQYLDSKSNTNTRYIDEYAAPRLLKGTSWFHFIFMDPELEKDLLNIGMLSNGELSQIEANTELFSRIYSNGHVTVLMSSNASALPTAPA